MFAIIKMMNKNNFRFYPPQNLSGNLNPTLRILRMSSMFSKLVLGLTVQESKHLFFDTLQSLSLLTSDCILRNIGLSSEEGPIISSLVVPRIEILETLKRKPFSEYSRP